MPDISPLNLLVLTFVGALIAFGLGWFLAQRFLPSQRSRQTDSDAPSLPKAKKAQLDGVDLYYVRQGKGPVILFLHGIGASSFTWRYQLTCLSKNFTVIAPDLPGFGKSSKSLDFQYSLDNMSQFFLKFMDHLQINEFFIAGSSMGGTIGLNMCRLSPQKIKKIALLAPATQPQLVPKGVDRLAWTSPWAKSILSKKTMAAIMKRVNANKTMINELTINACLNPYLEDKNSVATFLKATRVIRDKRLPDLFDSLQIESIILYGAKDKMVPLWAMKRLSKLLHSELYTHPEAGHHPHEDEYKWVNENIKVFFSSNVKPTQL